MAQHKTSDAEIATAIRSVRERHGVQANFAYARTVISKVGNMYVQQKFSTYKFGELYRLALNEMNLRGEERQTYAWILGAFYSRRSAFRRKSQKPQSERVVTQASERVVATKLQENGQFAWEI